MAKQTVGFLGGFQGTLGPAIGYMWNGKWCVRSRPAAVRNPRTEAQVAHREMFKCEMQLAAALGPVIRTTLRDAGRGMGMTSYNVFVSMNQDAFGMSTDDARQAAFTVDWQRLRLGMGGVEPVENPCMTLTEDNVLEVRYEKGYGDSHDRVHMVVYAPGLRRCLMSKPVFRKDKLVAMMLPDRFAGEELQVWLLVQDSEGEWSDSVFVPDQDISPAAQPEGEVPRTSRSGQSEETGVQNDTDDAVGAGDFG